MAASPIRVMPDSNVWFDWYKGKTTRATLALDQALEEERVGVHPDIIKEFALGKKTERLTNAIEALRQLPRIDELSISEFLAVVDEFGLRGSGKSRDTFLFAAAIQHGVLVLTGDRAFQRKSERVGLCFLCAERIPHD